MEIRAIAPNEWNYTYSQSMQITGQTGNIGHLRGDFDSGGYGFYTTWSDHRPQWKTDEFKTELDEVINTLRSKEYGLLQNRPAMSEYARRFPDSAFKGNYCTEYGFRVDTEKYAYLLRCNPTKGDYNFYCYCYVKEWLDKHIGNAEKGIRFIDSHYKELFRIPDGGKIRVTSAWVKSRNTLAVISTSTIPKSAITSIISASLPSVWKKTVRPMSRYLPSRRRSKHRSIRI